MPELPEVETIVRGLHPVITGKGFWQCIVYWDRSVAHPEAQLIGEKITGQIIQKVTRRGKYIVIPLSRDTLLVHLRMSGDLRFESQPNHLFLHDRIEFQFEDGSRLVFNDARKFGRVWLVDDPVKVLGSLGPEPLDESFTAAEFHGMLGSCRRQLKPLLLDQTFLAGLGNIYTDEALHLAGLHPATLTDRLDLADAERLLVAIRSVLQEGIRRNGASIDWVYRGGEFQNYFRVYHRTGEPCIVCGTEIKRIVVAQRGTHYCPICQLER